jgi:hypothetical protein
VHDERSSGGVTTVLIDPRRRLVSRTFYGTARTPGQVLARKIACDELAAVLMALAEVEGVSVVGPGGLLAGLTKTVLETALGAEMAWIASDDLNRSDPAAGVRSGSTIATDPACGNTDVAVGRGRCADLEG